MYNIEPFSVWSSTCPAATNMHVNKCPTKTGCGLWSACSELCAQRSELAQHKAYRFRSSSSSSSLSVQQWKQMHLPALFATCTTCIDMHADRKQRSVPRVLRVSVFIQRECVNILLRMRRCRDLHRTRQIVHNIIYTMAARNPHRTQTASVRI